MGLELAKALQHADLKLVSPGKVDNFLDLFSANGGANLGAFMSSLRQVEPELADRLIGVMDRLGTSREAIAKRIP